MDKIDKIEKNNIVKYVVYNMSFSAADFLRTGSLTTTFLLFIGITNQQISFNTSIQSFFGLITLLIASFFCDKFKKVKNLIIVLSVLIGFSLISLIIDAKTGYNPNIKYVIYVIGVSISTIAMNFFQSIYQKFPYELFRIEKYGKISATGGFYTGLLSVFLSLITSICVKNFDFISVIITVYIVSAALYVCSSIICFSFKKFDGNVIEQSTKQSVSFKNIIKIPFFTKLLPFYFLEGIGSAIFGLSIGFAVDLGIFATYEQTSTVLLMSSLGVVCGAFLYLLMEKKLSTITILIIVGLFLPLSTILLLLFKNSYVFLAIYFIRCVFSTIMGYPLYVSIYKCVNKDCVGKYHSLRNIVCSIGTILGGYLGGILMLYIHPIFYMIFSALCYFLDIMFIAYFSKKYSIKN